MILCVPALETAWVDRMGVVLSPAEGGQQLDYTNIEMGYLQRRRRVVFAANLSRGRFARMAAALARAGKLISARGASHHTQSAAPAFLPPIARRGCPATAGVFHRLPSAAAPSFLSSAGQNPRRALPSSWWCGAGPNQPCAMTSCAGKHQAIWPSVCSNAVRKASA